MSLNQPTENVWINNLPSGNFKIKLKNKLRPIIVPNADVIQYKKNGDAINQAFDE